MVQQREEERQTREREIPPHTKLAARGGQKEKQQKLEKCGVYQKFAVCLLVSHQQDYKNEG